MHDWDEAERVRQRLAHHLHDGPIQELTAAQLFLDGLALRMEAQGVDPALRDSLERGLAALRNATVGCRQLMDSLRPGLEGEGELAERLRRLVSALPSGADTEVQVQVPPGMGRSDTAAALALYRIVEDVVEQARRGSVRIGLLRLIAHEGRAELEVRAEAGFDAGTADFEAAALRAKHAGGQLELAEAGRTVLVSLPLRGGDAEVP